MIPNIDFNNFSTKNALPPKKRIYAYWNALFKWIVSQLKYNHGIYKDYLYGTPAPYWDGVTTYQKGFNVKFRHAVYESVKDSNINHNVEDQNWWTKIIDDIPGIIERCKYTFQKITVEYAINRYFDLEIYNGGFTGFFQPPSRSDIYLENVTPSINSFVSYTTADHTSKSFTDKASDYSFTVPTTYANSNSYKFSVNIPEDVYSQININPDIAEKIVRNFVDQFVVCGISYIVQTY